MGVTGDFAKLDELMRSLATVPDLRRDVFQAFAEDARTRIDEGFAASRSTAGQPWRPLAQPRRRGPGRPLLDTGRLRASITYRVDASGFVVETNVVYAATHQFGRGAIPARPFFPAPGTLPPAWEMDWREQADAAMRGHFS